ncbi:MAG: phenylalanine 4-monooxygenase, partial [Caulobacteraceae bacterium]
MDGSNPAASPPPSPPLGARADWTIDQEWERYTSAEHDVWRTLCERQAALLPGRACQAFLDGLKALDLHGGGIPDFRRVNPQLERLTGWTIVAVPGLIPDQVFFEHLASRRFPAGSFIRKASQLDYLQEPDVFHDVFGHVPMLTDPAFADYMQAYGEGGLRASRLAHLHHLARLYWYTVEFGLMESAAGLRIYGAGIVSSRSETVFALEDPSPNRLGFDLERVMRTPYRIDDFQQTYFVIDSFEALRRETYQDFAPIYRALEGARVLAPAEID